MEFPVKMSRFSYWMAVLIASAYLSATLQAASIAIPRNDSTVYLTPRDSVMLEISDDKSWSKYTRHVFTARQTVYSLSRFYAQGIDEVYALNPYLATGSTPTIGDTVRVAVPNVAITRFRNDNFDRDRFAPVCYRVAPGQTAYHIARTIFRMPVDTFLVLNELESPALAVGQVVQVGWMDLSGAAAHIRPAAMDPLQRINVGNAERYRRSAVLSDRRELVRGVATYTPGTGDASGKLFALYDAAPIGSILRVGNPANNHVAYVEVIGSLPRGTRREHVDVVVSGTAARVLGASTGNFYVTIQ